MRQMLKARGLVFLLKCLAPICVVAGSMHVFLGPRADVLLGARLPLEVLADPALDSQNRFYGAAFTLYGCLLYLCATDLSRYALVLRWTLLVFFVGGLARIVSIWSCGIPPAPVLGLLMSELLLPAALAVWMSSVKAGTAGK
jgi:hypothetical protein